MWVYGWNKPGFMPDTPAEPADTWESARAALVWELERADCDTEADETAADAAISELGAAVVGQPVTTSPVMGYVFWIAEE